MRKVSGVFGILNTGFGTWMWRSVDRERLFEYSDRWILSPDDSLELDFLCLSERFAAIVVCLALLVGEVRSDGAY